MKERKDPHGNVLPVGVLWVKRRGVCNVATKDGSRVAHSIEEASEIKAEFDAYVASNPDFVLGTALSTQEVFDESGRMDPKEE